MPSPPRSLAARKKASMAQELSHPGFIARYLAHMRSQNPEGADSLEADLAELFTSEIGLRVLILLEKSVLFVGVPDGASDGALREHNAVRNFYLEIRRYAAHGR